MKPLQGPPELPQKPGLLSFYDGHKLQYITAATNLAQACETFLKDNAADPLVKSLTHFHHRPCDHHLVNMIKASLLKKRFVPTLNRKFDEDFPYALYTFKDAQGLRQFKIRKTQLNKAPCALYRTKKQAFRKLQFIYEQTKINATAAKKQVNRLRSELAEELRFPSAWMKISLRHGGSENPALIIEAGRIRRIEESQKSQMIYETPLMRKLCIDHLRQCLKTPDHPYLIEWASATRPHHWQEVSAMDFHRHEWCPSWRAMSALGPDAGHPQYL